MSHPTILNQTIALEDYISVWIDAFITDKRQENLSHHTIRFYRVYLREFSEHCDNHSVKLIGELTPQFIRNFLLYLEEQGHNIGGQLVYFRSIKAFLNWYWDEVE